MRYVAIAAALLMLPFGAVQAADEHDECNSLTATRPCHDFTVTPPQPAQSKRYFLYFGWATMNNPTHPDARGTPNDEHKTPSSAVQGAPGGTAYPYSAVAGVLYEDTNGLGGLQRFKYRLTPEIEYPPDRMVLV